MLDQINHVVVLMLENRSFDSVLGKLYPKTAGFNGLSGQEFNLDTNGKPISVWNTPGTDKPTMSTPDPDPGELFTDINFQLFGDASVPSPAPIPPMSGFVKNYLSQTDKPPGSFSAETVMHYFSPEQVPVLSQLAREFAVCDQWHASAPCQTWPNRFFVHCGTANGYENNSPSHFLYEMPTIFNQIEDAKVPGGWKIYFNDMPQSMTLSKLWPLVDHFRLYPEFQHDARSGTLPAYSFIEPRYFADVALPNDQHPPHVVTMGEQLIADVYNCLRSGPNWTETLLIITYDEHGGCYDHAPPPAAPPPSANKTAPFNFDRYGVRVPAVIVSPYVAAGTVLRSTGPHPFDHTSILATLRKRFDLGAPLSLREAAAPDIEGALTLAAPTNLGPARVDALAYVQSPADVANAQAKPLNSMQRGLLGIAGHLPATVATGDFPTFIESHMEMLRSGVVASEVDANQDAASAVSFIKTRLGNLFRSADS